jgi:hypothetical protein
LGLSASRFTELAQLQQPSGGDLQTLVPIPVGGLRQRQQGIDLMRLRLRPAEARSILRQLIGPIVVLSKTYDVDVPADYLPEDAGVAVWWTGSVNVNDVLAGIDGVGNRMASPAGFEPAFWP